MRVSIHKLSKLSKSRQDPARDHEMPGHPNGPERPWPLTLSPKSKNSRVEDDVVEVLVVPLLCSGWAPGDGLEGGRPADGTAAYARLDGH